VKQTPALRALTFLGSALLLLTAFEACGNDDDSSALAVGGPPSISITKTGACGKSVDVTLNINNWLLRQPGLCLSTPQCGQVRVTLTKGSDQFASKVAASAAVDLTVALPVGIYDVEAELIDDSGKVYTSNDVGSSSAQGSLVVTAVGDCPSDAAGGAPGSGSSSPSDAGAAGFGGAAPTSGAAGSDGIVAGAGGS
jgi:hypothetical protein